MTCKHDFVPVQAFQKYNKKTKPQGFSSHDFIQAYNVVLVCKKCYKVRKVIGKTAEK